ncbi:MAG: hypothetical protein Greene041619_521 [Candidatus Peregrinibacteria bacterium Greene0416_19]|nr:MAG: hypothetical protein Greene041619_521 [Candidatus Peregrinibacteria bacterium Greene0416_19]
MSDSWLDHIPNHEREKIRKRMRSPEEYERLREKVKGPEDLEKEMDRNETMAELTFSLETEPGVHDALKAQIEKDIIDTGIERVLDAPPSMDHKLKLERGKFTVTVSAHPSTHHDQLAVMPEGKVREKLPLKPAMSDRYVSQFGGI